MTHTVVLGAGIGGMSAAYELRGTLGSGPDITVVGEGDRFSFTPSNPWVAEGWRKPADVEMPVAAYLAKKKIAFEGAGAEKVEPDANRIVLRDGRTLDYDYLLIATGPRLAFDEIPGLGPAAPEQWATSSLSHPFQPPAFTQQEQQILDLIESFGEALERSLYFGDPWPSSWRGNPQIARQLLLAVSFNVNEVRDFPLTKYIQVSGNLTGFIRSPLHQQEPIKKLRWGAFRDVSDPALRRAGLWATAWALMPERPVHLSPGWFKLPAHIEVRIRSI